MDTVLMTVNALACLLICRVDEYREDGGDNHEACEEVSLAELFENQRNSKELNKLQFNIPLYDSIDDLKRTKIGTYRRFERKANNSVCQYGWHTDTRMYAAYVEDLDEYLSDLAENNTCLTEAMLKEFQKTFMEDYWRDLKRKHPVQNAQPPCQ